MKRYLLCIPILLGILALIGCSSTGQLSTRHQETGVNTRFRYDGMTFKEYIDHAQRIILKYRVDVEPGTQTRILEANSPFEFLPDARACGLAKGEKPERGILLIHGLSDSPFMMRDLAAHFQSRCFLVRGLLLPGHGTVPGDLLSVTFEEWIKATQFGIRGLAGRVKRLYVGGFSTGGTLAVREGLRDERIDGILLFSPAIEIQTKVGFMANWHKPVSWANKELKWIDLADDVDYAKYESFPMNAADQIHLLTKQLPWLRAQGRQLKMPVFMAASMDDATVDSQAALEFVLDQPHPKNRIVIYTNRNFPRDSDSRVTLVTGEIPAMNVREFSHLSLTLSPANPHYGVNGDYNNCLHYLQDQPKFMLCKSDRTLPYGEITDDNMRSGLFRRLTFNPYFDDLTSHIDRFFKAIE